MRFDKLTTKFRLGLGEAESLAIGRSHQFIEPLHLMLALLDQDGGNARSLLARSNVNVSQLRSSLGNALDKLAQVEGNQGEVHLSGSLAKLLNVCDGLAQKRKDQFITSELFILAAVDGKGTLGKLMRDAGASATSLEKAIRHDARRSVC